MKTLYLVYIGNSIDLLIAEDEVVINHYCDHIGGYEAFETTARAVAGALGGDIKERVLPDNLHSTVEDMFEAITPDNPSDKHIAEYVMEESFEKEFE